MSLIHFGKDQKLPRNTHGEFVRKIDLEMLRHPLVQHATGKCDACGSTLVADPLPHQCGDFGMRAIDPGRCAL